MRFPIASKSRSHITLMSSFPSKKKDLLDSPHMTEAERETVLKWRARNWTPAPDEDEIDFWERESSTPDDPELAAEQEAAHDAMHRVARLERLEAQS